MKNLKVVVLAVLLFLGSTFAVNAIDKPPLQWPAVTAGPASSETAPANSRDSLVQIIQNQHLAPLGPTNFLRYLIRSAINQGVTPNTIIFLFLLPLVGALVGVLQYLVGLSGFGLFIPAMLAVTFLATGIAGGLFLFATIVFVNSLVGRWLRPIRLHYWPRRAIVLTFTALATFGALILAPYLGLATLARVSIFPILFFVLLAEEFARTQLGKSKQAAMRLTLATLVLAILGAILMKWALLQRLVLLNPELALLLILIFNVLIGRYSGFRLLEYRRFYSIWSRH